MRRVVEHELNMMAVRAASNVAAVSNRILILGFGIFLCFAEFEHI